MTEQDDIIEKLLQLRDEANRLRTEAADLRNDALTIVNRNYMTARDSIIYPEKVKDDTKET